VNDELTRILEDPATVGEIPREDIPPLLCRLAAAQSALAARLLTTPANGDSSSPDDVLVDVKNAASRTGLSESFLYKNPMPFKVREGGRVLFSSNGISAWIKKRQGR